VKFFCLALGVIALLTGCSRSSVENKEAVRQGIIDYLAGRPGLDANSMQVEIVTVNFRENEADALVDFKPKGGSGGGMQMNYTLERQGSKWVVKNRRDSGASPHGGTPEAGAPGGAQPGAMPPGHPPVDAPPAGQTPDSGGKKQ
jgi:hypothetical protein